MMIILPFWRSNPGCSNWRRGQQPAALVPPTFRSLPAGSNCNVHSSHAVWCSCTHWSLPHLRTQDATASVLCPAEYSSTLAVIPDLLFGRNAIYLDDGGSGWQLQIISFGLIENQLKMLMKSLSAVNTT